MLASANVPSLGQVLRLEVVSGRRLARTLKYISWQVKDRRVCARLMGMFGYPQSHSYTLNLPLKVMVLYGHWFIQLLIQKRDHLEDWRNSKSESSYSMMR